MNYIMMMCPVQQEHFRSVVMSALLVEKRDAGLYMVDNGLNLTFSMGALSMK